MTESKLERLIKLLQEFQYEIEDDIDKEGDRILGRAKDYCRTCLARKQHKL